MSESSAPPPATPEDLRVDEAEYRVGAFVPPARIRRPWGLGKSPLHLPVFRDAAQRMRERGLANDDKWVQDTFPGTLCPQGTWRIFTGHANQFTGTAPYVTIHDADTGTDVHIRIIASTGPFASTDARLVSVERLVVPVDAGDSPLPVDIAWRGLGQVTDDIVVEARSVRNGAFTVRGGADYKDGESVDIVDNVARATLNVGWFGRPRNVEVSADSLARVLHEVLIESAGGAT